MLEYLPLANRGTYKGDMATRNAPPDFSGNAGTRTPLRPDTPKNAANVCFIARELPSIPVSPAVVQIRSPRHIEPLCLSQVGVCLQLTTPGSLRGCRRAISDSGELAGGSRTIGTKSIMHGFLSADSTQCPATFILLVAAIRGGTHSQIGNLYTPLSSDYGMECLGRDVRSIYLNCLYPLTLVFFHLL